MDLEEEVTSVAFAIRHMWWLLVEFSFGASKSDVEVVEIVITPTTSSCCSSSFSMDEYS
jgi:hypothetical protein